MKHQARKRFGQNFLQDTFVIRQILDNLQLQAEDNLLEIGPGLGALTLPLLSEVNRLTVIEIDRDLQQYWLDKGNPKLHLIAADALKVDFSQFGPKLRLVGNLPYNISSPLLARLMLFIDSLEDMHFMLQKEVVDRLVAQPGCKDYGRLSILIQYYCEAEALFEVPPEAFSPQPKVQSAVVRLSPRSAALAPDLPFAELEPLVAKAFAMRRKTLANNLKGLVSAEDIERLGIDPRQRPEQISIQDFLKLAKFLR